jgi:hypothetical protein
MLPKPLGGRHTVAAVELTDKAATTRIVVLGASNVSRGLARLASVARSRAGGRLDLFVTAGHGRSYGANSRVAARRLPSILGSGLWRALDREAAGTPADAARPLTLVTDIGNDLLYGFSVEQVASWVRAAVKRLADRGGRIAITRLPLESIAGVGPARYAALRTLYVPGCRLSLAALRDAAADLDHHVVAIANEHAATTIEQPGGWYGLDAIHVRRRRLDDLWHRVADTWTLPAATGPGPTWREWAVVGSRTAEVRSLARHMLFTPQPCATLTDVRLWLY